MSKTEIVGVIGRQVLDSRGNPTVEAEVQLSGGVVCTAISPSGASTGKYEALELRDGDMQIYGGKGVQQACKNISGAICKALRGMDAGNLFAIDHALIALDGTKNKAVLGANATLAVSMACAKAAACAKNMALFRFLGGTQAHLMPMPMMNILNGGRTRGQRAGRAGIHDRARRREGFPRGAANGRGGLSRAGSSAQKEGSFHGRGR